MLTFLATFVVFVLVIFGMSLGWIVKRKAFRAAAAVFPLLGWKRFATARNRAMRGRKGWPANSSALFNFL